MALTAGAATLVLLSLLLVGALSTTALRPSENSHHPKTQPHKFVPGWASSPPTVDGILSPGEWRASNSVDFNISYNIGNPVTTGTLYVMNDARNLYLALKIRDSTFNAGDNLDLFFDNNNTGVQKDGDDVLQFDVNSLLTSHTGFFDEFWRSSFGSIGRLEDRADSGTTDGAGAGTGDGQYNYFEISHPLHSGDLKHDFSLKPGDPVGLLVGYDDDGRIGSYWPSQIPGILNYAQRAQITLATPPLGR